MKVAKISIKHTNNGLFIQCDDKKVLNAIEYSLCKAAIETNKTFLMGCNV